jgi:serine/threonine-protein kinase
MNLEKRRGSVLCVDDEPGILRSLRWLLQKEFDVMTASSGQQGLALVQCNDFDVVISDQRMPGMSGSEFLREVRKTSPRALRILLTGYSDLQAILRSVNEGEVFRFINKPWNITELPRVVGEAAAIAQEHPFEELATEALSSNSIPSSSEPILLIDDDPAVADLLGLALGSSARIVHASSLPDAIEFLGRENISVIVSDLHVDGVDTTRLLKMLKQKHPQVVTVVFSEMNDAADIITLINQGQIYRYVQKPAKMNYMGIVIHSALRKHQQLLESPDMVKRHIVEGLDSDVKKGLIEDVELATLRNSAVARRTVGEVAILSRITSSFLRLFRA